jgi:hypothetical protein
VSTEPNDMSSKLAKLSVQAVRPADVRRPQVSKAQPARQNTTAAAAAAAATTGPDSDGYDSAADSDFETPPESDDDDSDGESGSEDSCGSSASSTGERSE